MNRFSGLLVLSLAAASSLAFPSCSKSGKSETPETSAAPTAAGPEAGATGDLEAAILAPGPKTISAVGSDGKEVVLEMATKLAETDTYLVNAVVPRDAAAGKAGVVTIHLSPKTGWKINQEFPTKLKVSSPEGVTVTPESQGRGEASTFSEKAAVFEVGFNSASAGEKAFAANFNFAVCTDATCDPKTAELAWNLSIK